MRCGFFRGIRARSPVRRHSANAADAVRPVSLLMTLAVTGGTVVAPRRSGRNVSDVKDTAGKTFIRDM
jgi:hypothetical protein